MSSNSSSSTPDTVYLTQEQAGDHLNLSPRTLEKMRSVGGGPRFKKLGKRIRYTKADLDAWASARSCDSTFDPVYAALRCNG